MASTTDSASLTASLTDAISTVSSTIAEGISETLTGSATTGSNSTATRTSSSTSRATTTEAFDAGEFENAEEFEGISLKAFVAALVAALAIFGVQMLLFFLLRNKLARIFKPKTYLVPERERTEPPPSSPWGMVKAMMNYSDREIINKCGLDAYFFLRYLKTLLVIFGPIACVVIPILVPLNYVDGRAQNAFASNTTLGPDGINSRLVRRAGDNSTDELNTVSGLDTLAWANIKPENTSRYTAHLILAICVVIWVCTVFFFELRVYIKVRQDYLTSAEHRLRASATTVLVNSIPKKWLSEEALRGLFDVFPGGIRNIWLNRDLSVLLDKVHDRTRVHIQLEKAETELIKTAKKNQLKIRAKQEKEQRKQSHTKAPTKKDIELRNKQEDEAAHRMAEGQNGTSSGQHDDVPHDVSQVQEELKGSVGSPEAGVERVERDANGNPLMGGLNMIGGGLARVGQGLFGGVGKAGKTFGGAFETTNGFTALNTDTRDVPSRGSDRRRVNFPRETNDDTPGTGAATPEQYRPSQTHSRSVSAFSQDSNAPKRSYEPPLFGNTVRKVSNLEEMYIKERVRFWQFWKPPSGGYASPIPQCAEGEEFPFLGHKKKEDEQPKTLWQKIRHAIPLFRPKDAPTVADYPEYLNPDAQEQDESPKEEWAKWVRKNDRPSHRLPLASWLPGIPFVTEKVDTIDWCRKELARLNMEIEEDQKHPERYPLMTSAFIQFNHQVSAHMACQSLTHHVPKHMTPRTIEISPNDVNWDNMAITWWQGWARTALAVIFIAIMIIFWAFPVAFTASLGQLDGLVNRFQWLSFIKDNGAVEEIAKRVVGILPALLLAILLVLVPLILDFLADFAGAKTGAQKAEFVQTSFFIFLFFQVFLVVSITSFFVASLDDLAGNLEKLGNAGSVLNLLASRLPKAANYFFSYMILQALSTSSGTLLQIGALLMWYIVARIMDSTARNKWTRNTRLHDIKWGSFFPVYTNFACIALIYSIVAPLISLFAIITFSLLWVAQRYSMLYVTRFDNDTGGVLYPRAINQTFTGLYVMELCLAGLFFLVEDENGNLACTTHGAVMIIALGLTILYQVLLNMSFSPLFRYLPITFEDEACIRDEKFQEDQDRRLGIMNDGDDLAGEEEDAKMDPAALAGSSREQARDDIEMRMFGESAQEDEKQQQLAAQQHGGGASRFAAIRPMRTIGTWAKKGESSTRKALALNTRRHSSAQSAALYRAKHRVKDLEAQRAIGEALFGGYHDEIEDLTPDERDTLVRYAFQHSALRARRPTVWLPRDDLGVSDGEIRRTEELSPYVWISNEGTALDSKIRVVYGRAPPDFSEVDLINL